MARLMEINAAIGARMRLRREQRGLTRQQLGAALGISFEQVQKYEQGTNQIGAGQLFLVAEALNLEPADFFRLVEEGGQTQETEETFTIRDATERRLIEKFRLIGRKDLRELAVGLVAGIVENPDMPALH